MKPIWVLASGLLLLSMTAQAGELNFESYGSADTIALVSSPDINGNTNVSPSQYRTSDLSDMKQNIAGLKSDIAKQRSEMEDLKRQLESKGGESLAGINRQLDALRKDNDNLGKQVTSLSAENKSLTESLKDAQRQLSAHNQSINSLSNKIK